LTTLDVGCGSLGSHTARGDVCLDLEPNPVNRPEHFVPGDAHNLPFEGEQFEDVNFFEVIEHVEQPVRCLREIWRVLKPHGMLRVSTPNPTHWRIILRHLLHIRVKVWEDHIYLWSREELENLLRKCGFQVVKAEYILDRDRERYEKGTHRLPDRIMHMFSLCHALTGRSVYIEALKIPV
jgi:2-polyprenyl-3-methyl-5-hydroxy-6-metoxy-1,4-benzoquinol methylase